MNVLTENIARQLEEVPKDWWDTIFSSEGWEKFLPVAEVLAGLSRRIIGDEIDWHSSSVFENGFDTSDVEAWQTATNFANGLIVAARVARGEIEANLKYEEH